MTYLTDSQKTSLNIYGGQALRDMVKAGTLPDCPEVNARISERLFWNNPANWNFAPWFRASYRCAQFRNGPVYVRKITLPNGRVEFAVAQVNGRWCDRLDPELAAKHLVSDRQGGKVVYLTDEQAKEADFQYNFALSR